MKSTQAQAAAMIRAELKAHGIAARVTSRSASMMDAVDVTTVDLPPWIAQKVDEYVRGFQYGSFDGMTDCYHVDNRRAELPQVKYASVHRKFSDAMWQAAFDAMRRYWSGGEQLPERYEDARNVYFQNGWVQDMVWRVLTGRDDVGFWQKPRQRAA